MRIGVLVTGASGQVGTAVCSLLAADPNVRVSAPDRYCLPLDRPNEIAARLSEVDPHMVLHLGAFTEVDRAELQPDLAFRVNRDATAEIAVWCGSRGRPLLYVSTDFVFDGTPPPGRARSAWLRSGYDTGDRPSPLNVYGASKLAGEGAVRASAPLHWIVRTSWVFGAGGSNFPTAILRQAAAGRSLRVVSDQIGRPTYAPDLACALLRLAGVSRGAAAAPPGTYHVAGTGIASWYDLALETLTRAGWRTDVRAVGSEEYPTPAARPRRSALSTASAATVGVRLPPWRSGVNRFLVTLVELMPELLPAFEGR